MARSKKPDRSLAHWRHFQHVDRYENKKIRLARRHYPYPVPCLGVGAITEDWKKKGVILAQIHGHRMSKMSPADINKGSIYGMVKYAKKSSIYPEIFDNCGIPNIVRRLTQMYHFGLFANIQLKKTFLGEDINAHERNHPSERMPRGPLEDIFKESPDQRFGWITPNTLSLAGNALHMLAEEAAHSFLLKWAGPRRCEEVFLQIAQDFEFSLAAAGNEQVISQAISTADRDDRAIIIPRNAINLRSGMGSLGNTMKYCAKILEERPSLETRPTLSTFCDQVITLCNILRDKKRGKAVRKAKKDIQWEVVSLGFKSAHLKIRANAMLDELDLEHEKTRMELEERLPKVESERLYVEMRENEDEILNGIRSDFEMHQQTYSTRVLKVVMKLCEETQGMSN